MKKILSLFAIGMLIYPFSANSLTITNETAQSRIDALNQKGKNRFVLIANASQKLDNGDVITAAICECDSLPGHCVNEYGTFNKRYGIRTKSGLELNPVFDFITSWENNTYLLKYYKEGRGADLDESWLALLDGNLKVIKVYNGEWGMQEVFHVQKNGKYGVVYSNVQQSIPFLYDTITDASVFDEVMNDDYETYSKTYAAKKNGKWGIMTTQEKTVIDFNYDYLSNLNHGNAIAEKNHKWGIISKTDSVIVPFQYDSITNDGDAFFVMKGKKWGFMNYQLEYKKTEFTFDEMLSEYATFGRVGKKWYRIAEGKIMSPDESYDGVLPRDNNSGPFVCLRKNGLIAVYNCDSRKLETDYIYSTVVNVLYERCDEDGTPNPDGNYPMYRFKMIKDNKEVEFTIRN
jgi:hypothetical protein